MEIPSEVEKAEAEVKAVKADVTTLRAKVVAFIHAHIAAGCIAATILGLLLVSWAIDRA